MNRVVVTGLGVLSSLGANLNEFWKNMEAGQSGIREIQREFLGPLSLKVGAALSQDPEELEDEPFSHYLSQAARQAIRQSGLSDFGQAALLVGTAAGGQRTMERTFHKLLVEGAKRVRPSTITRFVANRPASALAQELTLRGPSYTLNTGCSSSTQAIGLGFQMIQQGMVDVAIAGGTDAPFTWGFLKSWEALRVIDTTPCRPFSADRAGTTLGEGAAVLILESLPSAKKRKASILAEILGYSTNMGGVGQTGLSLEAAASCMKLALRSAQIEPHEIDYLNAHGTGTIQNDALETKAIHEVFGAHARTLPISSTKSSHGHVLGAAGAMEAVATIMALQHQIAPPTLNWTARDPECDLDYITEGARPVKIQRALSNSFAFGGINSCLVLGRASE